MFSPNHPTSNTEDAFSSNFPDYTTASPGNISLDPPDNLSKNLLASPAISPFHNVQVYNDKPPILPQDPITPPTILTPSPKQSCILVSPSSSTYTPTPPLIYELGKSSIKMRVQHHEKQVESILRYIEELSFHYIEKMGEKLVNGWIIIPRDFYEVKTKLKEAHTLIRELQKKRMLRDVAVYYHFAISTFTVKIVIRLSAFILEYLLQLHIRCHQMLPGPTAVTMEVRIPPSHHVPIGCMGCFANSGKGKQKPKFGRQGIGQAKYPRQDQNLSLKETIHKKYPVIRGVPLCYPSWMKVPKEQKATLITDIE
nr:hypothetical protein [Tanacetum cinerariifolium]